MGQSLSILISDSAVAASGAVFSHFQGSPAKMYPIALKAHAWRTLVEQHYLLHRAEHQFIVYKDHKTTENTRRYCSNFLISYITWISILAFCNHVIMAFKQPFAPHREWVCLNQLPSFLGHYIVYTSLDTGKDSTTHWDTNFWYSDFHISHLKTSNI